MSIFYFKQSWINSKKTNFTSIQTNANIPIQELEAKLKSIWDGISTITIPNKKILFSDISVEDSKKKLTSLKKELRKKYFYVRTIKNNAIIYKQNKVLSLIAYDENSESIIEYC